MRSRPNAKQSCTDSLHCTREIAPAPPIAPGCGLFASPHGARLILIACATQLPFSVPWLKARPNRTMYPS
ncbi:hypothetical protein AMC99_01984 [Altererythrobacter epoxidivorans]|uniref:Uncharacterized protein n=1 Tax=Altererythrobacter epoxidivorans TaxID=361183 RepID=A0A0M3TAK8_9SPHN|nr:hypothetical protein AMC99_01984 [Altererythrobacter epoxidivorans]